MQARKSAQLITSVNYSKWTKYLGILIDSNVWVNYGRRCTIAGCNDNKVEAHLYRQPNGDFDLEVSAGYSVTSETIDQMFFLYTTNVTTTGTFFLDNTLGRGMKFIASNYTQSYKEFKNRFPSISLNASKPFQHRIFLSSSIEVKEL